MLRRTMPKQLIVHEKQESFAERLLCNKSNVRHCSWSVRKKSGGRLSGDHSSRPFINPRFFKVKKTIYGKEICVIFLCKHHETCICKRLGMCIQTL